LPRLPIAGVSTILSCTKTLLAAAACGIAATASTPVLSKVMNTVVVRGAQFIPAEDIRMTCGAEPGIDYLDIELRAIEDCLMSTGVFDSVALSREGDTLVITVQELDTRPGRVDASLAYVSQDGITGSLSYERYNLFDRTYGAVNLEFGEEVQRGGLSLYRTEAFETALDLGFDLVAGREEYNDRSYTYETVRAETYLAWSLSETTRLEGGIGYRDHRMYDLDPTASVLLMQEATNGISAPYVRLGLRHEQSAPARDGKEDWDQFAYRVSLDQYFWNIGTDDPLSDTRFAAQMQFPLSRDTRLLFGFDAGAVSGTSGNNTRTIDRFFPGADTFRGFAPRGIGPRDGTDALGGNTFVKASIELQRDFGEIYRTPFRAGVFVDTGASWDLDDTLGGTIDDSWHRRSSFGVSVVFDVGKTPVSLFVATPFEHQPGDERQVFGLSLTTRF
jgi:outer membrane protein insertion porin family